MLMVAYMKFIEYRGRTYKWKSGLTNFWTIGKFYINGYISSFPEIWGSDPNKQY